MGRDSRPTPRKGRGATTNPAGRFERHALAASDEPEEHPEEDPPRLATIVTPEVTRSIIARNDSPDVPFDRSINPYRGCEHGCVYCFARPTHSYLGLSPGLDFESRIFSKPDAAVLLEEELRKPAYRCASLSLGANTDPYQPVERDLGITRSLLEVLARYRHPVSIVTKSALVLRDLDLLAPLAAEGLLSVFVSVTTLDASLAGTLEPRAASPRRRVETLRVLARSGVPVGVLASPMIPALNDSELERILEACASAGARWANYILVRLPHEVEELFVAWLAAHVPLRAEHVLAQLREMRGGRLYDPSFGSRMRGRGPLAELLERRFEVACRRLKLNVAPLELDTTRFAVPPRRGDQLELFR